jgi:hypothetical protein
MKRLTSEYIKNSSVIEVDLEPEVYDQLMQNLFTALRKFSTSRKTRAVHKLLTARVVLPGLFTGNAAQYLVHSNKKGNTVRAVFFNLYFFDDSLDGKGAVNHASKLMELEKKVQKEKTYLTDKQIYNLEQLNKEKEEVNEKLLHSLDYIKLIDGIYFAWLAVMADSALGAESRTKAKIVTTAADILASILKKFYLIVNSKIEGDIHQLIEAIAIYFIRIYYYGETAAFALKKMEGVFSEDILTAIQKTKVTQFKEFNDLSVIMKEAQLLPLTKSTFDLQMQKMFGKYGYEYYIQGTLSMFIAFMANLAHPSQLFKDAFGIDEEACERLEILLLNEQKQIKLERKD